MELCAACACGAPSETRPDAHLEEELPYLVVGDGLTRQPGEARGEERRKCSGARRLRHEAQPQPARVVGGAGAREQLVPKADAPLQPRSADGGAARAAGLWDSADQLINPAHLGYLPRDEVMAVATGSQGEPRTALRRLAAGTHPDFELEAGDTVIFSARAIPGNEEAIEALVARLRELGVRVITAEDADLPIHASGHPAQEELELMYKWVRPAIAIPVHGEAEHMETHADIAKATGVPRAMVGRNGDLFMIRPVPGIRRQVVETGRLGWHKEGLVRVE